MSALLRGVAKNSGQDQMAVTAHLRARAIEDASERPRVLHLVTSFEAGGTERQFVELLKRLDRKRYDVRLAALRVEGPFYEEIAADFPAIPEFRLTSFYNRNALRQLNRLQSLLKRERIHILHTHGFYDSLFGSVAGRLSGIRVIASQRHLQLSSRRAHDWGTRVIHHLAHRIIVNSEAIRDCIIQRSRTPAGKIVVIHNGLCEANQEHAGHRATQIIGQVTEDSSAEGRRLSRKALCAELCLPEQVKIIGMVARLVAVKGHQYFLEAAAQVAREDASLHFVLIGDGPLRSELENQSRQLGIAERVHFLGDRKDARQLVAAFDVAALTSLSEGLPNSVMEAMSAAVPVIATRVGGTTELINDGETGFLIPPANSEALAERLRFVLRHETLCRIIAAKGRELITQQFSLRRMVESVENLYEEMMAKD
jgi:glycosyltransferase involved in cell wall biosynthesis